jgi:hypothetical protein
LASTSARIAAASSGRADAASLSMKALNLLVVLFVALFVAKRGSPKSRTPGSFDPGVLWTVSVGQANRATDPENS